MPIKRERERLKEKQRERGEKDIFFACLYHVK